MSDGAVWSPTSDRRERANVTGFLRWLADRDQLRFDGYEQLWRWSVEDLGAFWEAVWAFYEVDSPTPHEASLAEPVIPGARWFAGARLNYAEALLTRADTLGASIVHVGEDGVVTDVTIDQLRGQVGALAATLRELGVGPGDRVAAYLPNVPEAIVAMLATASLGAVWSVCAPDFASSSVIDRFSQIEPTVLIAVDGYRFNGRRHDRFETISELQAGLPSLRATIVSRRLNPDRALPDIPGVLDFSEACSPARDPEFATLEFAHPLWILFSSGTTGLPKGIVQSHGGILLEHLKSLGLCMDLGPSDRYLFYSSTSWMAWNYLVGGLLHGTTIVLYDGSPAYGDPVALWRVAASTGATVLGMGSAYAAACQRAAVSLDALALEGLRTVIPTGSPLGPAGWRWLSEQLGPEVRIDSICGGTDVCTAFFGGSELLPVWAGEASCRWLGIGAHAFDPEGHELVGEVGEFVLTVPMPSMPIGLWGDESGERYRSTYVDTYPGVWRQGDWIEISARGSVRILGRSDATLNRGGVRLGSAEIYAAVDALEEIADSLVVGVEQPDGGYWMPLFVVSDADPDLLRERITLAIRAALSPRHVPDEVIKVPAIPRTLTGKKLEIPVKRILQGMPSDQAAATGSVDHPEALAFFAQFAAGRRHGSAAQGADAMWGSAQTVTVGDHPVRVVRRGEGSPLLLINGIGAPAEMWAPMAACLNGRELVAVDLPGVGSTPPSHRPLRMPGLADLVAGLLDRLGYDRIDVLGYSFGGSVAQELAWRAPDRVGRLVLCASTSGVGSAPPRPLAAMMVMTPARYENRALARWIMPVLAGGRTRRDAAVLEATLTQRLANPPSRLGYLHQLYAITGWTSHPWLRRVRHRTLIVHGDQDPLVPVVNARLMAKTMPDARLHVLEGAGHLFLVDEPSSVVGELNGFLTPTV